jgi:2-polyprenyl-3-methyl-5-hydroxy-6-metoxy-1,4-benzoquinol methylase
MSSTQEIKRSQCPACNSSRAEIVTKEYLNDDEFQISRCSDCDLTYTSYQSRDHNEGYKADRATFMAKYQDILNRKRLHDRHKNYLEEVGVIKRHVQQGRLLDVGCNAGWLLGYLKENTNLELYGLEPSKTLAEVTKERLGVSVTNNYLIDGVFEENYFNFLTMTDVFEHVANPNTVLQVVHKILKPGGKVLIKVPNGRFTLMKQSIKNIRLLDFAIYGEDIWDAKEHLIHYSKPTLEKVLEKNGFKVVEWHTPLPIQTRGSSLITKLGRQVVYWGGQSALIPSQDLMVIAEKS